MNLNEVKASNNTKRLIEVKEDETEDSIKAKKIING